MLDGLIYALLLDGQGGSRELTGSEIESWEEKQGVMWLHFDFSQPAAYQWLKDKSGLDSIEFEALTADETRPRAATNKDMVLMSLRGVNMNPGANPEDMVSIRLWSDGKRIISTRRRRLLSVDDIIDSLKKGRGPRDAGGFICYLAERLTARMHDAIEAAEDEVSELEEATLTANRSNLRSELSGLRRQLIALRRFLAPQREALSRLQAESPPWLEDHHRHQLREVSDRMMVYIDVLDSVRERAAVTQEELVNQLSEEANQRMYMLSIVAAIFLPLGFFTGLLGINVGGMPGVENAMAFWIVCAVCILAVGVQLWLFRNKRWL